MQCKTCSPKIQLLQLQHKVIPLHSTAVEQVKLTKQMDDDIESYLTTFERIMAENEVSRDRWSYQLAT